MLEGLLLDPSAFLLNRPKTGAQISLAAENVVVTRIHLTELVGQFTFDVWCRRGRKE